MAGARSYRELRVWILAVDLAEMVYLATRALPVDERYGLTSQMRRAAVSIAANIAEGNGRAHVREYLHHLSFAHGSLHELDTLLCIVKRLHLLPSRSVEEIEQRIAQAGALLRALIVSLCGRARATGESVSRVPSPVSRST